MALIGGMDGVLKIYFLIKNIKKFKNIFRILSIFLIFIIQYLVILSEKNDGYHTLYNLFLGKD